MRLPWKGAAVAAAMVAAPLARAHDFVCVKTVNGQQSLEVSTFPTTLNYLWVITNPLTTPSTITSLDDTMFDISLTLPLTLAPGASTSATQTIVLDDLEECVELANNPSPGSPIQFTNTLTVGFDGGSRTCKATVLCRPPGKGCLTRTPGFWGNHPGVTEEFLPIESCGHELTTTTAGTAGSVTEDICSVGKDHKLYDSPQQAQLVRQCAAAALNIAASEALGGSCTAGSTLFERCCSDCGSVASGCIEDLDAFNNSADTLLEDGNEIELCHALGLGPPCGADPSQCQAAQGNGFINATPTASSPTVSAPTAAPTSAPTSGGCGSGPAGVLALLATAGLLAGLRRRR